MKVRERITSFFRRKPVTAEELAARAEAEAIREQLAQERAQARAQERFNDPGSGIGPF